MLKLYYSYTIDASDVMPLEVVQVSGMQQDHERVMVNPNLLMD